MKLVKGEPKDARILKNIHVRAIKKAIEVFCLMNIWIPWL